MMHIRDSPLILIEAAYIFEDSSVKRGISKKIISHAAASYEE
jgi:hypothetical protein